MTMPKQSSPRVLLCLVTAASLNIGAMSQWVAGDELPPVDGDAIKTLGEWMDSDGAAFLKPVAIGPAPADRLIVAPPDAGVRNDLLTEGAWKRTPAAVGAATSPETPASADIESRVSSDELERLLLSAQAAIAEGDLRRAHLLAEAAADMPIRFEVFSQYPERILQEIAFVVGSRIKNSQSDIRQTAWIQDAPTETAPPAPAVTQKPPYTEDIPEDGQTDGTPGDREFRALQPNSLSIQPLALDVDGNQQELPERRAERILDRSPEVAHTIGFSRDWTALSYSWEAPVARNQPLYFEDPELERYGNEYCHIQPFVSAARFYLTFPTMPYQMSLPNNAWFHCVYDLGHERPGTCVPYSIHTLPVDWTAGLSATGIITGIAFALMTP